MTRTLPLLCVLTTTFLASTMSAGPRDLWKEGVRRMKRGSLDRACPILEKATEQDPRNGALWADLGLCEFKRGQRWPSIHASLLAVRWGDEQMRKNAYFNLHKALALPSGEKDVTGVDPSSIEACSLHTPDPEFGPGKPIYLCDIYGDVGGTMHEEVSLEYAFVIENDRPKYTSEGSSGAIDGWPLYDEMLQSAEADSVTEPNAATGSDAPLRSYLISESVHSWYSGHGCDWDMKSSKVVSKWIRRCQKKPHSNFDGCLKKAEARVEKAQNEQGTWPELDEEIQEAHDDICGTYSDRTDCTVVAIDPEHLRAGVVCTRDGEGDFKSATMKEQPDVKEVQLQVYRKLPPPPDAGSPE